MFYTEHTGAELTYASQFINSVGENQTIVDGQVYRRKRGRCEPEEDVRWIRQKASKEEVPVQNNQHTDQKPRQIC